MVAPTDRESAGENQPLGWGKPARAVEDGDASADLIRGNLPQGLRARSGRLIVATGVGPAWQRLGFVAQEPAQLGVVAGHRGPAFPLGAVFGPLQHVMQVGEQIGTEDGGDENVVAGRRGGHGGESGAPDRATGQDQAISIVLDSIHDSGGTLVASIASRCQSLQATARGPSVPPPLLVATRQTSSSGRPKSPRIQVVLSEELLEQLATAAEADCRTVSNLARVLIQQGLQQRLSAAGGGRPQENLRDSLERSQAGSPRRLRGRPRRIRLRGPFRA